MGRRGGRRIGTETAHPADRQRREEGRRSRAALTARPSAAPRYEAHRDAHRLRHDQLRRLHRARRRQGDQELHDACRPGRRPRGHHCRRAGRGQRVASAAGGVQGPTRLAVRLLHARDDSGRQGAARPEPRSGRGGRPLGPVRQPLPMHRLPEHRQVGALGRRQDAGGVLMTKALDEIKSGGRGARRKRVEDDRFVVGKGNYTDDIVLPGMLHMEILRSPLAHARIVSIDTSKAWEIPGVRLVLTGEMMAQRNLAWMPTLSYDTQAVLATNKVRFQGQEVCVVVADDPYIAKDGCEAIVVEYEALPPIVNPEQAAAPDAPIIRDDKEGQTDNTCYRWEVGDAAATERAFAQADVVSSLKLHYPRSHPSPIECCGSIADYDAGTGKLTVYMTTQAPHIIRAAVALVAELPEHMIRIVSPDIGGGFGNKVPIYPGYVASILASILLGRPVKSIEDNSGNLISTGFGRDMY